VTCEHCGYQNGPEATYCQDCNLPLWKGLQGRGNIRGRSTVQFSQMVGGVKPRRASTNVAGWRIAVGAVGIIAVVVVAFLALRSYGLLGSSSGSAAGSRTDLCQSGAGQNCRGYQISLPYLVEGRNSNVSPCDSIEPGGAGTYLQFGYATSVAMYGALVPSVLYWGGGNLSYSANPAGFYDDPSDVDQAAWNSGVVPVVGNHSVDVAVPDNYPQWCLSWWDSGSPGVITFSTDAYLA
jgi:hypothetical protein